MSSSPSWPRAAVIDVVEIWAEVNSDVAAEAEKIAVSESIVWETQLSGEGGDSGRVKRVHQECLMGWEVCILCCSISTRLIM